MADTVTTTKTFSPSASRSVADDNPGRPGSNTGPHHSPTQYDNLPLPPDGRLLGDEPNETLRSVLARLGIPDAHTAGRSILAERYAKLISDVRRAGGDKALGDFLQSRRT
jgi:hypothetical protein